MEERASYAPVVSSPDISAAVHDVHLSKEREYDVSSYRAEKCTPMDHQLK